MQPAYQSFFFTFAQKIWRKKNKEVSAVKDAMKFTADFYKEVFKVYGEQGEQLAKALAEQSKGKKIRNVDDALKAYAKHQANINKKINAKDRAAIANALESVKVDDIAKNFRRFSNAMKYTSAAIDFVDCIIELQKAIPTDNWRPFFVKTETIVAGIENKAHIYGNGSIDNNSQAEKIKRYDNAQ
ncbi:MAG TPA: colicin-like pore-forming protein [Arsenophonus nasoniae]|uniref:colicin-like pore-forming protein n=1 Tax=Arsenophonus nasoniae TaxID=638 RepID=UPI003879C7AC